MGLTWEALRACAETTEAVILKLFCKVPQLQHILRFPRDVSTAGFLSPADVFVCGGYNGEVILGDVWKLNLQTFQWVKLPAAMPEPVYFHCAAVTPVSDSLLACIAQVQGVCPSIVPLVWAAAGAEQLLPPGCSILREAESCSEVTTPTTSV